MYFQYLEVKCLTIIAQRLHVTLHVISMLLYYHCFNSPSRLFLNSGIILLAKL